MLDPAFRICTISDVPEFIPVLANWHHDEWLKGAQKPKAGDAAPERIEDRIKNLEAHCTPDAIPVSFVICCQDEPVGSVSIVSYSFVKPMSSSRRWLTNLFVAPEFRRRGLATALLGHAEQYAFEQGIRILYLYTRDQSHFYQSRAWKKLGEGRVQGSEVDILTFEVKV